MEIPMDLIKQVQISLRRQAKLESYDPNDTSFEELPSPEEAAAAIDRTAENRRCSHCDATLLRGSQSLICVFCGRESFDDVVPEPLNFRDTIGFRWFLDSLDLDGSEIVPISVEANSRNRGRATTVNEFPLYELLDLEIKWPSEFEKFGSHLSIEKPVQSEASVNLSSVSAQNFFSNREKSGLDNASLEPSVNQTLNKDGVQGHNNLSLFESAQVKEIENPEESIQVQHNLNLFENAESSKAVSLSTEDENNHSDSNWGANFQSAPSAGANLESTSFDPFVESADLSAHMDEVFGPPKDSSSHDKDEVATIASAPMTSDWFTDNSWNNSDLGLSGLSQETKVRADLTNGTVVENIKYSSSTDVDWIQDGRWQSDNAKERNQNADEGDDSFDDWNDFASSTPAQDSSDSWKQTTILTEDKTSEINLFSPANQPHDTEFEDSFSQQDLFAREFSNPDISTEVNKFPMEASVSERTTDVHTKPRWTSDDIKEGTDMFAVETSSKPDDVETILSQMHDLSFMLASDLSIPPTQEGLNSLSRN